MADEDMFWFRFAVQSAKVRALSSGAGRLRDDAEPERCGMTNGEARRGVLGLEARAWPHVAG